MGLEYTSIYGAIRLDRGYERSINFIKSLGQDGYYPFINTNMFSLGDYETPYYYDDMMLSFGATYKGFGLDLVNWNFLVLKLEHILRNIDFKIAQFHIDSYLGDFTLFWTKEGPSLLGEENEKKYIEEYHLQKTNEWYFGYGERNMFVGYLRNETNNYNNLEELGLGFKYPIAFDPAAIDYVHQQFDKTAHLPIGSVIDVRLRPLNSLLDRVDEVLYSLVLAGKIQFAGSLGWEKITILQQPWYT